MKLPAKSRSRLFVPLPALVSAAAMLAGPSVRCADELCAYWPLDENSGTVVPNNSASAAANLYNGASWVTGTINNALSFNGYNQFVTGAVTAPLTDTAVSMWFRTSQAGGGLYSATTQDGSGHDRHIYLDGGNIHSRIWNEETISSTDKNYADGQWHQIVHTFGGVAGGQKLYVDGELVASGSKTSSDFNWQTHVQLGYSVSSPTQFFNGQLDDVRIWNRALTAAEALALALRSGTANYPNPPSIGIIGGATLKLDWLAPTGATSHDIYLSGSPDVANSTPASEDFMGNFITKPLDVADATPGYYYWRVDERLDTTLFKGPVWSFQYLGTTSSNAINLAQPTAWWVGANESFLQSGVISGSGIFYKDGPGTLILTGSNTNSGGTVIRDGILQIGEGGTSGSLGSGPVSVYSTLAFNRSDNFTFSGTLDGPGNITQNGPGDLTLSGIGINYSGNTVLNEGSLTIAGTPNFNSAIQINAGQLIFDTTSNYIVAPKVISGTGSVAINGNNGNWTHLTADNTYTGGTIINSGGLLLLGMNTANGSVLGDIIDNGTLGLYHSNDWTFSNNVSGTGALNIYSPNGNPVTISGNTVSLTSLNVFQNPGGILTDTAVNLTGSLNLWPDSTLTIGSGADVTVAGGMTQVGNAYNHTMSTLKVTGGNLTFGDQINDGWDGSYSILQTGGTLTAPGITGGNGGGEPAVNTITLEGGTLVLGASGINGPFYKWPWFPNGGGLTMNLNLGGGTLSASDDWSTSWGATLTGTNGDLTINPAGNTINLNGSLTGNGGINLTGAGRLLLNGTNNYSGNTTIGAGTTLGGAGSVSGPVVNNGTLAPGSNGTGNLTLSNTLTIDPDSAIEFQVSDWTGAPGTGYSNLAVNALNFTATTEHPVTLRIRSQSVTNFSEIPKTFTLIQSEEPIVSTIDPAQFVIETSGFTAGLGTWSVKKTDNKIDLVYAPTEDADGDGLTYAEEIEFGSNPNNPDSDGDGLTDAQEKLLGTDPNVADNPDIGNESIMNGDFSEFAIGDGSGNYGRALEEGWDYWVGIPGWQAIVGQNIELQTIWQSDTGGQYCELKAEPEGHFGITQKVGTVIGKTYLLALDCKVRPDTTANESDFEIQIDGSSVKSITAPYEWTTQVVAFTATKVITEISLVPLTNQNDTVGCLVDNVRLLPVEIDAFGYGETNRKIDNCVQRTKSADTDDNVRVITGGHVKFRADIEDSEVPIQYEWSFSAGEADSTNTNKEINWNAPTTDNELTVTLKIKDNSGSLISSIEVKITPIKPRIVRVKFIDDGSNRIVKLKDSGKNAVITAPQYDRIDEGDWETTGGHEAHQDDHKNDEMEVFKNESIAYVRGGKMKVEADLAATDLRNEIMGKPHTHSQHKDLSVNTPLKMSVVDSAPSLSFKNNSSSEELGNEFEVKDWSALDYSAETTFVSDQALGAGGKSQFYWESTLNWTIKVKNKDGAWVNSLGGNNTSDTVHRSLCVPDKAPIVPPFNNGSGISAANEAWEKVMQYSCDWSKGISGGNVAADLAMVDAMWAGIDVPNTSASGARHNINYTFTVSCPFTVRDFVKGGLQGSCGHMARFFSSVAAAQGLTVDIETFTLVPDLVGQVSDAFHFATNVPDIDGDWCEYAGGPAGHPNALWYYNNGSPGNHSFNSYGGHVYDPTFGIKKAGTNWDKYLSDAISNYSILQAGNTTVIWKTKAQVTAPDRVRFTHHKNYSPVGGIQTWPQFP